MRVLVFGGRGFLGQYFLRIFPDALAPSVDITDATAVAHALDEAQPDVVINAVGRTGSPNVDWCEEHKLETMHANVLGPLVLMEECSKRGIYWVHLSSGCIYEGTKGMKGTKGEKRTKGEQEEGWTEEDEPNFTGSFYARSKALCERAIREFPGMLILRLRMPFDGSSHPKNLITKLAKYARVNDEENSITCLTDFLVATKVLIDRRATGIYNMVNEGVISPYRIMELYREVVDPHHSFERLPLPSQAGVTKVGRSNCVLSTTKLEGEGIRLRPVEEAVRESLFQMKNAASHSEKSDIVNTSFVQ